jgi:hypothetical protein
MMPGEAEAAKVVGQFPGFICPMSRRHLCLPRRDSARLLWSWHSARSMVRTPSGSRNLRAIPGKSVIWKFRFQACPLALRRPEEQLIPVRVPDDKSRFPPITECCFDPSCADVLAQLRYLVVIKTNKNAAMSRVLFGPVVNLIQDELESEKTDLKNERTAFFLMIPVQRETKGLRVKCERLFGVLHKEHGSCVEVIHLTLPLQTSL